MNTFDRFWIGYVAYGHAPNALVDVETLPWLWSLGHSRGRDFKFLKLEETY